MSLSFGSKFLLKGNMRYLSGSLMPSFSLPLEWDLLRRVKLMATVWIYWEVNVILDAQVRFLHFFLCLPENLSGQRLPWRIFSKYIFDFASRCVLQKVRELRFRIPISTVQLHCLATQTWGETSSLSWGLRKEGRKAPWEKEDCSQVCLQDFNFILQI